MTDFVAKCSEKKGVIATVASIVAICGALFGMYMTLTNNLEAAKVKRSEQVLVIEKSIATLQSEVQHLQADVEETNKRDIAFGKKLDKHIGEELTDRLNRLEDAVMGSKHTRRPQ